MPPCRTPLSWTRCRGLSPIGWTVLAVDRRSAGASSMPPDDQPGPVDVQVHVDDIIAVLDAMAPGPAALVVGHSYGGCVGLELAARRPDRVAGAWLFEPPYLSIRPDASAGGAAALGGRITAIARDVGLGAAALAFLETVNGRDVLDRLPPGAVARFEREGRGAVADSALLGFRPDGLARHRGTGRDRPGRSQPGSVRGRSRRRSPSASRAAPWNGSRRSATAAPSVARHRTRRHPLLCSTCRSCRPSAPATWRHPVTGNRVAPDRIRDMFDTISGVYDPMNTLISGFQEPRWRRRAVRAAALAPGMRAAGCRDRHGQGRGGSVARRPARRRGGGDRLRGGDARGGSQALRGSRRPDVHDG